MCQIHATGLRTLPGMLSQKRLCENVTDRWRVVDVERLDQAVVIDAVLDGQAVANWKDEAAQPLMITQFSSSRFCVPRPRRSRACKSPRVRRRSSG